MTRKRQTSFEDTIIVRSLSLRLPSDYRIESHIHDWHQLIYAIEGAMTVETTLGIWVVPPHRAVWIQAGFEHAIRMTGQVKMRTVYFRPDLAAHVPDSCCVIEVTPLLRELIVETTRLGMLTAKALDGASEHARLAGVLLDQVTRTRETPLQIKFPLDVRARRVADRAQADLAVSKPIALLARGSGASVRTIERLFVRETEMTFGRWLQRVKALHALERLAAGDSVTGAGLAVGFDSTSAFIAMSNGFSAPRPEPTSCSLSRICRRRRRLPRPIFAKEPFQRLTEIVRR